ncbi:adenylate/guanylate cyclase domain-containing protein [Roseofilum sp. BLCC_M91]|uniref:Adenylate/guanylate cyclase domain-containing protein n=1 Tax=Roseofilum halophilum BLCC-M91 TaxID=3022259 RepID=A0ABT7BJ01_9CYAN|nr:adenylate/guanylate cyclase domain-containing protein [Roseofilum halophilum]MDJ1179171.1 adenylate/guanylate cyclase domain-containing protein [Roseofilum halophilum BLCC-M91]
MKIKLKSLINKSTLKNIIQEWLDLFPGNVGIFDKNRNLLMGRTAPFFPQEYTIKVEGEVIGWVRGDEGSSAVSSLLNYLVNQSLSQKALVNETLERYKEINLLYRISEEMSACLDMGVIAELVLKEARDIIDSTQGEVLLVDPEHQRFTTLAQFGDSPSRDLAIDDGIVGYVLSTGVAEVINDVENDPRLSDTERFNRALICAPLKSRHEAFGVIWIGHSQLTSYRAADLKLLTALASQTANAMENARFHNYQLQQERIKSNLERYMSPQLVKAIIDNKEESLLKTGKKDLVILFSDIRNFTTHCEMLEPEKIVEYLNIYFTHMVDVIFSYGGTVNKFVGDMIVCMFGAPAPLEESEKKAIETAIAMQECLQSIPVPWIRDNFKTGIGISSGEVVVGNIGARQHVDYTAIGDKVNTGSRLQAIAKGGQILVDRTIYDRTIDQFDFKEVGLVNVKGKMHTIEVFEVLY